MRTRAELAADPLKTRVTGLARRMIITLTGTASAMKAIWQVAGVDMPNGKETAKAENFSGGIGVAARPPAANKPEALVIMVGADAGQPVIVAAVDRKTRDAIAGALKPDETMLHNSKAFVHVKDDGTIEARSKNGVAVPLATLADIQALRATFNVHKHTGVTTGPGLSAITDTLADAPSGTTKLKGE